MRRNHGFTLIELAITVAIVGILAAIAVPALGGMIAKSRQVEAKTNLATIFDLEVAYQKEVLRYGTLAEIAFVPEGAARYSYCAGSPALAGACIQSSAAAFDFGSGSGLALPPPPPPSGGSGMPSGGSGRPNGGNMHPPQGGGSTGGSGSNPAPPSGSGGKTLGGSTGGPPPSSGGPSGGSTGPQGGVPGPKTAGGPLITAGPTTGTAPAGGGGGGAGAVVPGGLGRNAGGGISGGSPTGGGGRGNLGAGMVGGLGSAIGGLATGGMATSALAANTNDPALIAGGNPHISEYDFEADAYGKISQAAVPHDVDRWMIDQTKQLENYTIGY